MLRRSQPVKSGGIVRPWWRTLSLLGPASEVPNTPVAACSSFPFHLGCQSFYSVSLEKEPTLRVVVGSEFGTVIVTLEELLAECRLAPVPACGCSLGESAGVHGVVGPGGRSSLIHQCDTTLAAGKGVKLPAVSHSGFERIAAHTTLQCPKK